MLSLRAPTSLARIASTHTRLTRTTLHHTRFPPPRRTNKTDSQRSFSMSIITETPKASSSAQPEWVKPTPEVPEPVLKVYNSLTRSKVRLYNLFATAAQD